MIGSLWRMLFIIILGIVCSIKLQASKKDVKFWNAERLLSEEPDGEWPEDAVNCQYVGAWSYWFRKNGMQTSTDDIIVALVAAYPELVTSIIGGLVSPSLSSLAWSESKAVESKVNRYLDLGWGSG
jgi:hypothetical protein